MCRVSRFLLVCGVAIGSSATSQAGVISTLGTPPDFSASPFGSFNLDFIPTFGQTFTAIAPDRTVLTGLTFLLGNPENPDNSGDPAIAFTARVYAWNGSGITGPALFVSATQTLGVTAGFEEVTVAVPSLSLTSGGQYIALLTTIGEADSENYGIMPLVTTNPYSGGLFLRNHSDTEDGLSGGWVGLGNSVDASFRLTFADPRLDPVSAPAPAGLILAAIGAPAIGLMRVRRKAG
jgi:hypothetical protein